MKVTSDFMRADVTFLMTEVATGQHFMPQHIFEDSKKMQAPMLEPGYYRIIVFMQNADMVAQAKFTPVLYSFNFKLFSFDQRSKTEIQQVQLDDSGNMVEVVDSVEIIMPFSSPEKMDCYSHGRRLPDSLTQDILKQETDFSFVFSIFGQDMAFINDHVIRYKPEEGEDMLRIAIDEGIMLRMYRLKEFERDHGESATPIAVSHDRLGNNVQEMIADGLSDREEYAIHVIFASDEDDFHQKASLECLIATMQVKIANSKSDFVCLNTRLDKLQ